MKKLILLFLLSSNCFSSSWECIETGGWAGCTLQRFWLPNGWIVRYPASASPSITFVPDPEHKWKL
jgi:hypothetical protein